jgi:hypothetical protein
METKDRMLKVVMYHTQVLMVIQEGMQIAKMEVVEVEELLLLEKTRV